MDEEEQVFHDLFTVFNRIQAVVYFELFPDTRQWVRTKVIRHISWISLECVILCSEALGNSAAENNAIEEKEWRYVKNGGHSHQPKDKLGQSLT